VNRIFVALFVAIFCLSAQSQQILPGTVHCMLGSVPHPTSYCADTTPCKDSNGKTICLAGTSNPPAGAYTSTATCWSVVTDYTCLQYVSDCATFTSDSLCTEVGTKQCGTDSDGNLLTSAIAKIGKCTSYTRSFSCIDPAKQASESYTQTTSCDISTTMNGLDWSASTGSASGDFLMAATGQEFARQLALYGAKDGEGISGLFPGSSQGCTSGMMGLKNCCKSSGGATNTNGSVVKSIGFSIAMDGFKKGAGYAAAAGSELVADTVLSNAPQFMQPGLTSMFDTAAKNSWGASGFGAFGVGTTAEAAGGMAFGEAGSMAIGESGLYFNPYALAAAIAIKIVMDAMACTPAEVELGHAKGENLCHYVGRYCSSKIRVLGIVVGCNETKQTYCCYNGLLAKAIEEGAHAQLGISWGSAENPSCGGLSVEQLTSLDFTTPAMQEAMKPFQQQIMENFNSKVAPSLSNGSIQTTVKGKASSSAESLCLQRQKLDPQTVCN
jgi:conjugal transfer mating pair stabilization protein TraN